MDRRCTLLALLAVSLLAKGGARARVIDRDACCPSGQPRAYESRA